MISSEYKSSNIKFKEQLSSFYEYLERNDRFNKTDDTQSCINMKISRISGSQSVNRTYSRNAFKLLNQQQHQQEEVYSCLFTPRLANRKQHSDKHNSSYLTWKSFNCDPIPSLAKETAIINDSSETIEKVELKQNTSNKSAYRYNLSNQNLGIIYDENDYECDDKENLNHVTRKKVSVSTPGTPLLSSCTMPRYFVQFDFFFFNFIFSCL